jgi:hypothetical protein
VGDAEEMIRPVPVVPFTDKMRCWIVKSIIGISSTYFDRFDKTTPVHETIHYAPLNIDGISQPSARYFRKKKITDDRIQW